MLRSTAKKFRALVMTADQIGEGKATQFIRAAKTAGCTKTIITCSRAYMKSWEDESRRTGKGAYLVVSHEVFRRDLYPFPSRWDCIILDEDPRTGLSICLIKEKKRAKKR